MSTELRNLKWAILVTGWGRNAKDTLEAFEANCFKKSSISLVIYESEPCGAAEKAREMGIETILLKRSDFSSIDNYQSELINIIKKSNIDYVFMLNYKYRIREEMLNAFPNRILNIHPSLFPSFLGTKTAIQDALEYGVKITGITTHVIDDKLDEGVIVEQVPIRVKKKDTFETLYPKFAKKGAKIIKKTILRIENNQFKSLKHG